LPFEEDVIRAYEECPAPFRVTTIDRMRPQIRNIEDFMIPPVYSNQSSSLIYVLNNSSRGFIQNSKDEYDSL
jgi:hypothetical protein